MGAVLEEIVTLLTQGISGIAQGIGSGLSELAQSMFVQVTNSGGTETRSLTMFGGLVVVFAGISLAIGLSRLVFNFVTSLGNN